MKAIEHSGFAPTNMGLRMDQWKSKAEKALHSLRNSMEKVAWLGHGESTFRERHLLDRNLGPAIRRTWW